jgi:hypothetical protein
MRYTDATALAKRASRSVAVATRHQWPYGSTKGRHSFIILLGV